MQLRKLKKHLPGCEVTKNGRKIEVRASGLGYIIDNSTRDRRSEADMAEHIRSKIPAATILPQ
jgi:hypothetical protein